MTFEKIISLVRKQKPTDADKAEAERISTVSLL